MTCQCGPNPFNPRGWGYASGVQGVERRNPFQPHDPGHGLWEAGYHAGEAARLNMANLRRQGIMPGHS